MYKPYFAILIVGLLAGACTSMTPKVRKQLLFENVTTFHDKVRWRRCEGAAVYVHESVRQEFLDLCEAMAERLGVQEIRIKKVTFSPGEEEATVQMRLDYYLLPSNVVSKHDATMKWIRRKDRWIATHASGAYYKEMWTMKAVETTSSEKDDDKANEKKRTYPLIPATSSE